MIYILFKNIDNGIEFFQVPFRGPARIVRGLVTLPAFCRIENI